MLDSAQTVAALGTIPQWAMFATLVLAVFKLIPVLRAQTLEGKQLDIDGLRAECQNLRGELRECREDCEAGERRNREENHLLQEEVFGLRKQHLAEQISLINIIIESVEAPELKTMLKTLESVQTQLRLQQRLAGTVT